MKENILSESGELFVTDSTDLQSLFNGSADLGGETRVVETTHSSLVGIVTKLSSS